MQDTVHTLQQELTAAAESVGLTVPGKVLQDLAAYVVLLDKWNQAYNLTAVRQPQMMIYHHILDALAGIPYLKYSPIIDVGSGAGLPGIPLALCLPDIQFTLLDSNGKKVRFIKQVIMELQIPNVNVVQSRVEAYQSGHKFAMVISRAVCAITELIKMTDHLLAPAGAYLCWKGENPQTEIAALDTDKAVKCISVTIPKVESGRHLVLLE